MFDGALLRKTVCLTTVFSFAFANLPGTAHAYGYRLIPESFEEMYALAQNGRVEALRSSINRGLNIDVMNSNGDTGLCVAARRHDFYTYNAFRAAGANPRHPCTQNISDYENFIHSSRAVSVTSTPRAAYSTIGHEEYRVSPNIWWWIGGAALIGGGVALAVGGGGGGGSSSNSGSSGGGGDDPTEDYNSLGAIVGSNGTISSSVSGSSSNNSTYYDVKNSKTEQISKVDLNSDILENTKYLDVVLNAKNSGKYTNTIDTVLKIGDGVVGMSAVKNSYVNNFGFINIDSYNASIGMIASEGSTATNHGRGIISSGSSGEELNNNGIALNFSGYDTSNTLIGMYADTKSTIQNYGDIKGTAIKSSQEKQTDDSNTNIGEEKVSATNGALIGMEAMIVNDGKDLNKDTIRVTNESSGKINLSAGDSGTTDETIKVSLTGMGSFLDNGFMNGSKDIKRAENIVMRNMGNITLGYTGNYIPSSDSSLRKGTGGIVGMRADANTTAYNHNSINLYLDEYSEGSSSIDVSAGMQSLHGGNLYNNKDAYINIVTSAGNARKNYGMLSVEGAGNVSELYTDSKQNISNSGNISIQASNSFGMASFNGGILKNSGNIVLGKPETTTLYQKNIGMYGYGKSKETTMENTGIIDIYSHDSVAMQNDFAGGTSIYNKGTINIYESATNSYVFGGAYSEAHNSKIINYYANSTGTPSSEGTKINPFANYSISIGNSAISTSGKSILDESSSTTSSTTERIYNDKDSTINIEGSSFISAMYVEKNESEEKTQGKAYNNGTININDNSNKSATNSIGMYLGENSINNANITNNGIINTNSKFSAAMASSSSENASVINTGTISTNKTFSLGIYSKDFTNIQNSGTLNINGDYSVGIYTTGNTGSSTIFNDANINVGTKDIAAEYSYGIYADGNSWHNITNNGIINTYTKERGIAIYSAAENNTDDKANYVSNKGTINVFNSDSYGIYVENDIYVTNKENAFINLGTIENSVSNSYGIYSAFIAEDFDYEPKGEIINNGDINIYSSKNNPSYGIYSGSALVKNRGHINVINGIAISGSNMEFINEANCSVSANNANAISGINKTTNFGNISATNGNGIFATNPKQIINNGDITITEDGNGIYVIVSSVEDEVEIINNGTINVDTGYAIYIVKNYELNKEESQEGDIKIITYTDNTTVEAGGADVKYTGACEPHCINGEVVYESTTASTSSVSMSLLSSDNNVEDIVFSNNNSLSDKKIDNPQVAQFLAENYSAQKGDDVFSTLKSATNSTQFNGYVNKELGFNMIPNLTEQSLETEKTVNSELNENLISPTNKNSRHQVNVLTYKNKVDAKHNISGYKDKVIAAYGFTDKAINDKFRLGFALSAIRLDSDFDDNSSRYNNLLEVSAPVIFNNSNLSMLFKPKAGFALGRYRRTAVNKTYKAKTKEFYYGFDSSVRNRFNLDYVLLEPNVGFNFTGLYNDNIKESNNGLKIKDSNTISAPAYLGLDIKKEFIFNGFNSLSLIAGGKYYHEFGEKDTRRATFDNMIGYYDITSNRLQRNYGLLSLKTVYSYKELTVSASANAPLKQKHNLYYMFNLGYNF